jgi:transcriptional regulator with XRE-family HTH domain
MEYQKLYDTRKAKGITQKQMANRIAMEQTTYSRKERGKSPITDEEWARLAKTLEVPVEEIKEENTTPISVKNENCTFTENAIGIQYVNIPQNVFDIIIKYNATLEKDNTKLEEENAVLRKQLE